MTAVPPERAIIPGGTHVVTVSTDGGIHVWNLPDGRKIRAIPSEGPERLWIAFDPTGRRFVTGDDKRGVESTFGLTLWSFPELTPLKLPLATNAEPRYPEFSPDGRYLMAEAGQGRLQVWNLDAGRVEGAPLIDGDLPMARGGFSPDGRWIVAHQADRSFVPHPARLWKALTREVVGVPMQHTDSIVSSAFGPDGTVLATGGQDATARIWSVPTGASLVPPMPHDGIVTRMLFTGDGRILATATRLGAVRLWDARTGQPLNAAYTVTGGVAAMTFVRGLGPFVVVGGDGAVHRWDLSPSLEAVGALEILARDLNGGVSEKGIERSPW